MAGSAIGKVAFPPVIPYNGGVSIRKFIPFLAVIVLMCVLSGCAINRLAMRAVGGMLSSGQDSTVFSGEEDPELLGDALPFALKLYEILLDEDPANAPLALTTGKAFISYASAFVQGPADMLSADQYDLQTAMRARAKKLFLRGRGYVFRGLETRRPGFMSAIMTKKPAEALSLAKREDIDYLYWTAAGWLGAFSSDPFDFSLIVTLPRAVALLEQVRAWDDEYGRGSLHEILISFYGSAPADIGGSEVKARESFTKAVEYSGGGRAGPYVALASAVCVKRQDYAEFKDLLMKALAIDVDEDPSSRLENIVGQQKARWLLDHAPDFFLDMGEGQE